MPHEKDNWVECISVKHEILNAVPKIEYSKGESDQDFLERVVDAVSGLSTDDDKLHKMSNAALSWITIAEAALSNEEEIPSFEAHIIFMSVS